MEHHVRHGQVDAQLVRVVLGVEDVLAVDGDTRARLIVAVDDLGNLVFIHGAAHKAAAGGFKGGLQVDARLGGEGIALAHGHQLRAADQVVDQLRDAAAAAAAGVDGVPHAGQQRFRLVKGLLLAAGHHGQRTGDGHGIAAGDGAVQQEHTGIQRLLVQIQHDIRRGGAEVDDDVAGFPQFDRTLHRMNDDGVRGQDLHHHVAGAVNVIGIGGNFAAEILEFRQPGLRHIVAQNGAAALLYDILGHGQTHNAKAQKSDFHDNFISFHLKFAQ